MDKKLLIGLASTLVLVLIGFYIYSENSSLSQKNQSPSQVSSPSDIAQPITYKGTLPCADCPGLDTTITLNPDHTYEMTEIYQDRNEDNPFVSKGDWTLETGTPQDPNAQVYALTDQNGTTSYYLLDGNEITSLDSDKNPIDSPFNMSLTQVDS